MTRAHSLITVECGCVHDGTFWVVYCKGHRVQVAQSRNRWDAYLGELIMRHNATAHEPTLAVPP